MDDLNNSNKDNNAENINFSNYPGSNTGNSSGDQNASPLPNEQEDNNLTKNKIQLSKESSFPNGQEGNNDKSEAGNENPPRSDSQPQGGINEAPHQTNPNYSGATPQSNPYGTPQGGSNNFRFSPGGFRPNGSNGPIPNGPNPNGYNGSNPNGYNPNGYNGPIPNGPNGPAGPNGPNSRPYAGPNAPYQGRSFPNGQYQPRQAFYCPPPIPPKKNGIFKSVFLFCLGIACSACLVFFMFGFLAFMFVIGLASLTSSVNMDQDTPVIVEKYISGNEMATSKVVILPVEGIITGNEDGFVRKAIKTAEEDTNVCAIVLRVNSPGGTVTGSDYYYHLLKKMKSTRKIPIIVSMGDLATSGGYYISMCGDVIFAERSSWTGSIGVIVSLYNAAELAKKVGFESTPITSGPMKGMGNSFKQMSDEEKAIWKNLVDKSYAQFLEVIREGRANFREGDGPKKLEKIADGRVYCASDAKQLQLIDKIGFLDDAISEALKKAGKNENDCCVVKYKPEETFFTKFAGAQFDVKKSALQSAATLLTPTPYYIAPNTLPIEF